MGRVLFKKIKVDMIVRGKKSLKTKILIYENL